MPRLKESLHNLLNIEPHDPKAPSSAGAGWRAPAWLTADVMLGLWLQLLSAIAYLEHHGVAHCDLHLGNIMVSSDGTLRVTDFGCSSRRGADGSWDIVVSSDEWRPGKPFTLAPEVRGCPTFITTNSEGRHVVMLRVPLGGQPAWEAAQAMFCMSTGRAWADAEAVRLLSQGSWRVEGDVLSAMGAAAQRVLAAMLQARAPSWETANRGLAALADAAGGWDRAGELVVQSRDSCRAALGLESAATPQAELERARREAEAAQHAILAQSAELERVRREAEAELLRTRQQLADELERARRSQHALVAERDSIAAELQAYRRREASLRVRCGRFRKRGPRQ